MFKAENVFTTSVFEEQLTQVNENDIYIKELFNTEKYAYLLL